MKKWWWGAGCFAVAGIIYSVILFYKHPADIRIEEAAMEISAEELTREFSVDEMIADKKFTDKVLIVGGTVTEVSTDSSAISISLTGADPMSGVTCSFYADEIDRIKQIKPGDVVRIKGKCTGMLVDVILNNCSVVVRSK